MFLSQNHNVHSSCGSDGLDLTPPGSDNDNSDEDDGNDDGKDNDGNSNDNDEELFGGNKVRTSGDDEEDAATT
jgi:hypothetical protein